MSRGDKYLRIYYDKLADECPEVWDSPLLLWTFTRLLAVAEAMWPTVPEVLRITDPDAVSRLMELGLVLSVPPYGYRIRSHDEERLSRQAHARGAANDRWDGIAPSIAPSSAPGNAVASPRRDASRAPRAEPSLTEGSLRAREPGSRPDRNAIIEAERQGRPDVAAFLERTGFPRVVPKVGKLLADLADRHDLTGYAWAAERIMEAPITTDRPGDDVIRHLLEADATYRAPRIEAANVEDRAAEERHRAAQARP